VVPCAFDPSLPLFTRLGGNLSISTSFATLERELIDRHCVGTHAEARHTVFESIEGFHNPRCRHSALGYHSPMCYERRHHPSPLGEST
jgi:hypothetical protein